MHSFCVYDFHSRPIRYPQLTSCCVRSDSTTTRSFRQLWGRTSSRASPHESHIAYYVHVRRLPTEHGHETAPYSAFWLSSCSRKYDFPCSTLGRADSGLDQALVALYYLKEVFRLPKQKTLSKDRNLVFRDIGPLLASGRLLLVKVFFINPTPTLIKLSPKYS